jgi:hypothetical protein
MFAEECGSFRIRIQDKSKAPAQKPGKEPVLKIILRE